mgnify:FL=1|jgi:hypothetical protein
MGGGTLQLIIKGGQDIYITGNPEISFFKSVYRRHTNFSIESIEQVQLGEIKNGEFTLNYTINKSGDLLSKMHFEIDLPLQDIQNITPFNYCHYNNVTGYTFLKDISLSIGEKEIDKHDGRYYDILNELKQYQGERGLDYLINRIPTTKEMIFVPSATKLFIPLHFWFCKDISQSIPLIALQFHEVKLKVTFRGIKHIINSQYESPLQGDVPVEDTVGGGDKLEPQKANVKLWANYIHLDVDERRKFAQEHHEYLIEQVQHVEKTYRQYIDIHLNHPVKSLYWVIQNDIAIKSKGDYKLIDNLKNTYGNPLYPNNSVQNIWIHGNDYLNYKIHEPVNPSHLRGETKYEHFKNMKLTFNGIDRFKARDATYFRTIQPYENNYTIPTKNVYMYSFCLNPEDHEPSGSCNFSRIDNFAISFTGNQSYTGYTLHLYAKNYNVLRIMEGMGGLLYAN